MKKLYDVDVSMLIINNYIITYRYLYHNTINNFIKTYGSTS